MLSNENEELELVRGWISTSLECPVKGEQYLQKIYTFLSNGRGGFDYRNTKQIALLIALLEWPDMPITSLILICKQLCLCSSYGDSDGGSGYNDGGVGGDHLNYNDYRNYLLQFPTDEGWILKSIANLHRIIDTFIPLHTSPITTTTTAEDPSMFEDLYQCSNLKAALDVFRLMNIAFKDVIPAHLWYSKSINHSSSPILLKNDFQRWKDGQQEKQTQQQYALIQYLFLVNLEQKLFLLRLEGAHSMRTEAQNSFFRALFEGPQRTYLLLTIPRSPPSLLLKCTLEQIEKSPPHLLRRQLRCRFKDEEGIDQGGLRKEFFQLLFAILTDPLFGMWVTLEDGTLWFNHLDPIVSSPLDREERLEEYRLSGILLGLAIYNGILLEVPFSTFLYKFLINDHLRFECGYSGFTMSSITPPPPTQLTTETTTETSTETTISFLKIINPSLYSSLINLLKVSEKDWDSLCLHWMITLPPPIGEDIDLRETIETITTTTTTTANSNNINIHNNKDEPVHFVDRLSFIKAYAALYHPLGPLLKESFLAFKSGFTKVHNTNNYLLQNMHHSEIAQLVEGEGAGDLDAWKDLSTRVQYENGFTSQSPLIVLLWSGFLLQKEESEWRERFLHFVTGSRKAPIGGLRCLDIKIIKNGASWLLPTAHTCFNTFLLPEYPLEDVDDGGTDLKKKAISYIKKSLENMTGFGLQ